MEKLETYLIVIGFGAGQYDGRGFLETMQHLKAMEEFRRTCSEDSTSEAGATEASPMHVEEVSSDGDEDRSAEQIPRKAPQKRRKAASNSFSESRRELEKASGIFLPELFWVTCSGTPCSFMARLSL